MHPVMIKAAIELAGFSQAEIAKELDDISRSTVHQVINGLTRSKRIEMRIAQLTGMKLAELWPQWYGPDVNRRRRPAMTSAQVAEMLRGASERAAG